MQAGRVGKCGDANVHLCGEPAPRPWRERCPALAPLTARRAGGLGWRQALAAPSAVGSSFGKTLMLVKNEGREEGDDRG